MKTSLLYTFLLMLLNIGPITAQQTMELTFTGIDSTYYARLDSIRVLNLNNGTDTMLYWSDTVLFLDMNVGIQEQNANLAFQLQAWPNPVRNEAILKATTHSEGDAVLRISDIRGRDLLKENFNLLPGGHTFKFIPGRESVYFFTFSMNNAKGHLMLVNINPQHQNEIFIDYMGSAQTGVEKSYSADLNPFEFKLGDKLIYTGYFDSLESAITDIPLLSESYTFQFAYDIPCIGTPSVNYEGQIYNTVQIFNQCWIKENLNVGSMIPSMQNMADNDIIEKYCYENEADSCIKYGGLYQWDEMMQYSTQHGSKGICPPGWRLPDDNDWKILEGNTDSYYGAADSVWTSTGYRGYDAGMKLKSTSYWKYGGNGIDSYGFSSLPGGYFQPNNMFDYVGRGSYWWSSSVNNTSDAWYRDLRFSNHDIYRGINPKGYGFSVRCLKDE